MGILVISFLNVTRESRERIRSARRSIAAPASLNVELRLIFQRHKSTSAALGHELIGRVEFTNPESSGRNDAIQAACQIRTPDGQPAKVTGRYAWFSRVEIHSSPTSRISAKNSKQRAEHKTVPRLIAQNPCEPVRQLIVVAESRFCLLHYEFVSAITLSLANMHLRPAFRTRLPPSGRGRIQSHSFAGLLSFQLLHPLFIRLCFGTLRMHSTRRVRHLTTNWADLALWSRVHRTWLFLIHGNLIG